MQTLPLALFLVMLELTVGSFISLHLLDLRGDTSRSFIIFQGVLYLVFAGLTLMAMNAFATPQLVHGYGLDESWLRAQGPLVLIFSLLMLPWNILLWRDKQLRPKRKVPAQAAESASSSSQSETSGVNRPIARRLRFGLGALVCLVGLVSLFVVGMAYRTLADTRLDGAFVVLAFVAGAIALGGVMTAMLLGHWYLNTPTASGKPLEFSTALLLAALAAELVFSLLIGPSTAHATATASTVAPGTTIQTNNGHITVTTPTAQPSDPTSQQIKTAEARQAPLSTGAFLWLQLLMGFLAPLILGAIALYLTRGRSFQSATGMLYLCVAFIFIGEVIGRGMLLFPVF